MHSKVDSKVKNRIIELITKQGLTQKVVAERLGLCTTTVRVYLKQHYASLKDKDVQR